MCACAYARAGAGVGKGRKRDAGAAEEAVIEKGAFEHEVRERVEGVPDEEDAVFGARTSGEQREGGEVGGEEEGGGGEEGEDGCLVD